MTSSNVNNTHLLQRRTAEKVHSNENDTVHMYCFVSAQVLEGVAALDTHTHVVVVVVGFLNFFF